MYFSIIHFDIAYRLRLSIGVKISDLEWPWTAYWPPTSMR